MVQGACDVTYVTGKSRLGLIQVGKSDLKSRRNTAVNGAKMSPIDGPDIRREFSDYHIGQLKELDRLRHALTVEQRLEHARKEAWAANLEVKSLWIG